MGRGVAVPLRCDQTGCRCAAVEGGGVVAGGHAQGAEARGYGPASLRSVGMPPA
jgi:hypothetical protein